MSIPYAGDKILGGKQGSEQQGPDLPGNQIPGENELFLKKKGVISGEKVGWTIRGPTIIFIKKQ